MDQTKFINSYIANLAERLKTLTLDNVMLNTQLTLANEQVAELTKMVQNQVESSYTTPADDTNSEYTIPEENSSVMGGWEEMNKEEPIDVDNSSSKKK